LRVRTLKEEGELKEKKEEEGNRRLRKRGEQKRRK
jgi:hypothetical protein